ncbi:MAG: hypothetical protein COA47_01190 [Robiginitomaculum sp.]|nr:MAG: hypothetical protein COA47_01190 [Robiginitomaculum sp.]
MAKPNKTQETDGDVAAFLDQVPKPQKREDCIIICQMMADLSGEPAKMWGKSIVGFGTYHYTYDSGREGNSTRVGFSPRAQNIVLYIIGGFSEFEDLLSRLGKHKHGKSCLYINKLMDVDVDVLRELIIASLAYMDAKYPKV